tara:strand:- start:30 stop:233 length:204 start_codon:yes stop_codon:yes gene_type:complete
MVMKKAEGNCLLNHCKQIGKPSDLKITFQQIKNISNISNLLKYNVGKKEKDFNLDSWFCTIEFSKKI